MNAAFRALEGSEAPGWNEPLGKTLPEFGPPHFRVMPYILAATGALVLLGVIGWVAYVLLFPPQLTALQLSQHATLREASLAWRELYARQHRTAASAKIWRQRSSASAAAMPYLLVQPVVQAEDGSAPPLEDGMVGVYGSPAEGWKPSLGRLSLSQQSETLGGEQLARGTIITVLQSADENRDDRLFVASADSPETGHLPGSVRVTAYAECLPIVDDEQLRTGLLATPMDPKAEVVYWVAWRNGKALVLETAACAGAEPLQARRAASGDIPPDMVPLLTFGGTSPYLLVTGRGEDPSAPLLLHYPAAGVQLKLVGSLEPAPKGILSAASAPKNLYDSFQPGLTTLDPTEPSVPVRGQAADGSTLYLVDSENNWGFYECANPSTENYLVKGSSEVCLYAQGSHVTLTHEELHPCRIGEKGDLERCEVTPEGLMLSYYFRDLKTGYYCRVIVERHPCKGPGAANLEDFKELERVR